MTVAVIMLAITLVLTALFWIMNGVEIRDDDWTLQSGLLALFMTICLIIVSTTFYERVLIESCVVENDLRNSQTCEVIAVPAMEEE